MQKQQVNSILRGIISVLCMLWMLCMLGMSPKSTMVSTRGPGIYIAVCNGLFRGCNWHGPVRTTYVDAVRDVKVHEQTVPGYCARSDPGRRVAKWRRINVSSG